MNLISRARTLENVLKDEFDRGRAHDQPHPFYTYTL